LDNIKSKDIELPVLDLFINPNKRDMLKAQEVEMKQLIRQYLLTMTNDTFKKVSI
jgi:hypothetical protein